MSGDITLRVMAMGFQPLALPDQGLHPGPPHE